MTRSPSASRPRPRVRFATLGLTAALVLGGAACGSAEDQANAALESASVSTGGDLPDGFPEAVPTPDLEMESGAGAVGEFVLRFTSKDHVADPAAYQKLLEGKGFTITDSFDFDEAQGDYSGFTATGEGHMIVASAYGPKAPGGGDYMGVVVSKAAAG